MRGLNINESHESSQNECRCNCYAIGKLQVFLLCLNTCNAVVYSHGPPLEVDFLNVIVAVINAWVSEVLVHFPDGIDIHRMFNIDH